MKQVAREDNQFSKLDLPGEAVDNLSQLGYTQLTQIQELALPLALAGKDLVAQAKTGSGKTASFGIPLLHKLKPRFFGTQSLVLCPTRELATQVADELRKLAKYQANIKIVVLSGGVAIGPQIGSLEHGAHVVVGTPGRIRDHLRKGTLDRSVRRSILPARRCWMQWRPGVIRFSFLRRRLRRMCSSITFCSLRLQLRPS